MSDRCYGRRLPDEPRLSPPQVMANACMNESNLPPTGIIILAAGASTRMGVPKQSLPYQGSNFLRHTVAVALASICRPVIVVLGAYAAQLQAEVRDLPLQVVENQQWSEGISSSILVGMQTLNSLPKKLAAVVLMVCDQPLVSAATIDRLVAAYQTTGKPIIASEYGGTLGVPALFSHSLFSQLSQLSGDRGAKQLLQQHCQRVFGIPFPEGAIDVDTPEDYEQFRSA